MGFEWLGRDEAAAALGVEAATLQQWIEQGRAPTRVQGDQVQVLIEFPEGEEREETGQPSASATDGGDTEAPLAPDLGAAGREMVSQRELQMAAGMIAAWQRVATTSEHELARSRRVSQVAVGCVALLIVVGTVGLWRSMHSIGEAQTKAALRQNDLEQAARQAENDRVRIADLLRNIEHLTGALTAAGERLAQANERAAGFEAQTAKLTEQLEAARQMNTAQGTTHQEHAETLKKTIDRHVERITALEAQAAAANTLTTELRQSLSDATAKLMTADATVKQMAAERDGNDKAYQTRIADLTALNTNLQAQVTKHAEMQTAAEAEIAKLKEQAAALMEQVKKLTEELAKKSPPAPEPKPEDSKPPPPPGENPPPPKDQPPASDAPKAPAP